MNCARCGTALQPGARHPALDDCFEALQAENAALRAKLEACKKCGIKPVCLCSGKRVARKAINEKAPGLGTALRIVGEILKPEDGD